jgi:hypothetical protein
MRAVLRGKIPSGLRFRSGQAAGGDEGGAGSSNHIDCDWDRGKGREGFEDGTQG